MDVGTYEENINVEKMFNWYNNIHLLHLQKGLANHRFV